MILPALAMERVEAGRGSGPGQRPDQPAAVLDLALRGARCLHARGELARDREKGFTKASARGVVIFAAKLDGEDFKQTRLSWRLRVVAPYILPPARFEVKPLLFRVWRHR